MDQDTDGLMIQCDKCQVWQHGDCVGVFKEIKGQYFCENCKPHHKIHVEARKHRAEVTQARQRRIAKGRTLRANRAGSGKDGNGGSTKKPKKRSGQKRPKTPRGPAKALPADSSSSQREQRKIERILESFRKLDEKSSRKKGAGVEGRSGKRLNKEFISNDRNRRARLRRGKRKSERNSNDEPHGVVPVSRLIEHSPMYFGRKAWLMRLYSRDQEVKNLSGFEELVDRGMPFHKRVLQTYVAQQERVNQDITKDEPPEPTKMPMLNGDSNHHCDSQETRPAAMDVETRASSDTIHDGVKLNHVASNQKIDNSHRVDFNKHREKESSVARSIATKKSMIHANRLNGHAMHVTTTAAI